LPGTFVQEFSHALTCSPLGASLFHYPTIVAYISCHDLTQPYTNPMQWGLFFWLRLRQTGEGKKGKKVRTASDDAGEKSATRMPRGYVTVRRLPTLVGKKLWKE
jgi:hypothetical protein